MAKQKTLSFTCPRCEVTFAFHTQEQVHMIEEHLRSENMRSGEAYLATISEDSCL